MLPILPGGARLARLIVQEAHRLDHRKDAGSVLAHSRRTAWILAARRLVHSVVKACMRCRLENRKVQQQIMGDVGREQMELVRPFHNITIDLMGPFPTKGLGGNARATFKCWGLVIVCSLTKAVALWAMIGYSTKDFLLAFSNHVAVYGAPAVVMSNCGSQLKSAAREATDWDNVQATSAGETRWVFVPPATPWRVGVAERVVALAKNALNRQLTVGEVLNFAQLEALLHRVAAILNERPLSARSFSEAEFQAITPKDLLLGAAPPV